jgi:hypothetical protein
LGTFPTFSDESAFDRAICRNYNKDLPVENAYDFNLKIFEENRSIAENQKPEIYVWLINRGRFPLGRQFEYISETFEKGEI